MQPGKQATLAVPAGEALNWAAIGLAALLTAFRLDPVGAAVRWPRGMWSVPCHGLLLAAVLLVGAGAVSARRRVRDLHARVSRLQAAEAGALNSASIDSLTGLLNRRAFKKRVDTVLTDLWPGLGIAVLLIDLDGFKTVNDVHGHEGGDKILCAVAGRLRAALSFGTCVARLGGDEFAVLIPYSLQHRAAAEAQAVVDVLCQEFRIDEIVIQLGASVGLARGPEHSSNTESLLCAADIAMFRAKKEGGSRVQPFHAWMETEIRERTVLKAELRGAIANGQIVPFYQPIVNLDTRRIVEFEVLARWQHPRHGCLPPSRFIDLVIGAGQATPMLLSLLQQVTCDAAHWPSEIRLSINIFPAQLTEPTLINMIEELARRRGLSATRLCLEVTEQALLQDPACARVAVEAARRHGMMVALDDFGTGYSSLYHLRELPFDRLKIDRSFLQSITTDERSAAYIGAIVAFSRSLGLEVVAEGIETEAAARLLAGMRCQFGQGYHFARPLPAADVGHLLSLDGRDLQEEAPARQSIASPGGIEAAALGVPTLTAT